MAKKLCVVCHIRPATVPDRYAGGRLINRVCSECHRERLRGDLKHVLKVCSAQEGRRDE